MSSNFTVQIDKDIEEIIPIFLDNRNKDIAAITAHLKENELTLIEVIAHKLAGNAGSYGFTELGKIGADMESACQKEDIDQVKALLEKFIEYMKNLNVEYV